jgi:hypothetical protein
MRRSLFVFALLAMMLAGGTAGQIASARAQSPTPVIDAQANKELMLKYYEEVWNNGNTDFVYEALVPDFNWWFGISELFLVGPDAVKAHADNLHTSIEGMGLTVDLILAEGDYVAVRWTLTSTPEGTPGAAATVLCTGNDIVRMENGMAAEMWQETVSCV